MNHADGSAQPTFTPRLTDPSVCVAMMCGVLACALGSTVLFGWHAHHPALVQIQPGFVAMVYNTALSFVTCGVALGAILCQRRRLAAWLGVPVLLIALLTIVQYTTGRDLGIDQALFEHYITVQTARPGRMAPNTALAFALAGVAFCVLGWRRRVASTSLIAAILGSVVAAVGLTSLSGYFTGIRIAYGWGPLVPMAAHTAFGCSLIGVGLVAGTWRDDRRNNGQRVPRWFPSLVGVAVVTITVGTWQALLNDGERIVEHALSRDGARLEQELTQHLRAAVAGATHIASAPDADEARERAIRWRTVGDRPEVVARLEQSTGVKWVVGDDSGTGNNDVFADQAIRRACAGPREAQLAFVSTGTRGGCWIALAPVVASRECWVAVLRDHSELTAAILDEHPDLKSLGWTLRVSGSTVGESPTERSDRDVLQRVTTLEHVPAHVEVESWPTPELRKELRSILPQVVLGSGLALAVALSVAVQLALTARRREREAVEAFGALREATQQRETAQDTMRRNERRLARIFETIADGILEFDAEGRIVASNPTAERMLGLSRASLLGLTLEDPRWKLDSADGTTLDPEAAPIRRVLTSGRAVHGAEISLDRGDGQRVAISVNAAPLEEDGRVSGVIASACDITRRKEVERLKDELVSTVSHELRTPLTSLRGFAELMLAKEYSREKQREFLEIIRGESERLTNLINDFLDLQRMESGRQRYEFGSVDIAKLVEETRTTFTGAAGKHVIQTQWPANLARVRACPDRVRQVLANLISNAIKFSPHGGTVRLVVRALEGHAEVAIEDDGIGIPPEVLPNLFTKFYRVDNRETRSIGGTGLGLALVKEIVTAHGGRVSAESRVGQGSTFKFTLPFIDSSERSQGIGSATAPVDVLLVEDDESYSRFLTERFAIEGLDVVTANSVSGAHELLSRGLPSVCLLDIHLSGERDGWDLLLDMRQDSRLSGIPVVVITGSDGVDARCLAFGGCNILDARNVGRLADTITARDPAARQRSVLAVGGPGFCAEIEAALGDAERFHVTHASGTSQTIQQVASSHVDTVVIDLESVPAEGYEVLRAMRADRKSLRIPVIGISRTTPIPTRELECLERLAVLVGKRSATPDDLLGIVRTAMEAGTESGSLVA